MRSSCGLVCKMSIPINKRLTKIAMFIVPYLQVVFGLECTLRSFRAIPFQARGKYDVTICCGTVVLMLIITWVPSHIFREPDVCFASLLWFVSRYGKLGSTLLCVAGGLMIISAITIYTKLSSVNLVDEHQRIAASRMVYYLAMGITSLVSSFETRVFCGLLIALVFCSSVLLLPDR